MAGHSDEQKPKTTLQDLPAEAGAEKELSSQEAGAVKGGMISLGTSTGGTYGLLEEDPDDPRLP